MTDFRTLKDFVVLARVRNFSQAAVHCNVTTSGLSRRISALEEWLGASVFDRTHHKLELTAAGAELHVTAIEILAQLEKTRSSIIGTQETKKRQISIAAPHIMSRAFFPSWLPMVGHQSKDIKLAVDFANLPECFRFLKERSADFVVAFSDKNNGIFSRLQKIIALDNYEYLKLGAESLVPVSAPNLLGEPLNSMASPKSEVSYLHYRQECSLGWALETMLCSNPDLPSLSKTHASSLADGLHSMAIMGLGVAWLPFEIVRSDLEKKSLVRAGDLTFDIALDINIFRRKELLGENAEWLWDCLRNTASSSRVSKSVTWPVQVAL